MKKKEDAEIRISPKMGKWKSLALKLSSLLTVGSNDGAAGVKPGKLPCIPVLTPYFTWDLAKVRDKHDKQNPTLVGLKIQWRKTRPPIHYQKL